MRALPNKAGLGLLCGAVAIVIACGHDERPPPAAPSSQTTTTSAGQGRQQPSYGDSDMDGWSDPAGVGTSTHGTATPGATPGTNDSWRGDSFTRPRGDAGL